jgi:hypothetical protein
LVKIDEKSEAEHNATLNKVRQTKEAIFSTQRFIIGQVYIYWPNIFGKPV